MKDGSRIQMVSNQRGVALVMVLILSVVSLGIMAGLVYMLTTSVKVTGIQQRYKTALEAAEAGGWITMQVLDFRGDQVYQNTFLDKLNALALNGDIRTDDTCFGGEDPATHEPYRKFATKALVNQPLWSPACNSSPINPNPVQPYFLIDILEPVTYDMTFDIGTYPVYKIFSKVADTVTGNTAPGLNKFLRRSGVVSNTGEIPTPTKPYLYYIEVHAERTDQRMEKADISILYEY